MQEPISAPMEQTSNWEGNVFLHETPIVEIVPAPPGSEPVTGSYIDKTGTDDKPNPLVDVFQEFPRAMAALAEVTAFGATKHAPRGWQTFEHDYAIRYHTGKMGRHLLAEETEGAINEGDGGLLHAAQVAWNAMARLDHIIWEREKVLVSVDRSGTVTEITSSPKRF